MFGNKKGMEMSLSVVVIAVILLIVLAVLMFIFFKSSTNFSEGISACPPSDCKVSAEFCNPENEVPVFMKCKTAGTGATGTICCKKLG